MKGSSNRNRFLLLYTGLPSQLCAVDLDGLTENMSKENPIGLDLNGSNVITTLARNSTFEDNATDWATNGNHVMTIDGGSALTGTYAGDITSSGVGDGTTNFVSLAADKFTTIVIGTKYTFQIEALATLADTNLTVVIGDKTKTFTAVSQTGETLVYNFEATASEVSQPIQIYLSQADTVLVDSVDLSEAYDMTIVQWVQTTDFVSYPVSWYIGNGTIDRIQGYFSSNKAWFGYSINSAFTQALNSQDNITVNTWYLLSVTINRTGNIILYVNGVAKHSSAINLAVLRGFTATFLGSTSSTGKLEGLVGESQIIRGYALTTAEILSNYNEGIKGKSMASSYLGGTIISWWKFKGNNDIDFLKDETGNNNLTGTNITQADDQIKLVNYN